MRLLHVSFCLAVYFSEDLNEHARLPHSSYEIMSSNVNLLFVEYLSYTQCSQGLDGEGEEE